MIAADNPARINWQCVPNNATSGLWMNSMMKGTKLPDDEFPAVSGMREMVFVLLVLTACTAGLADMLSSVDGGDRLDLSRPILAFSYVPLLALASLPQGSVRADGVSWYTLTTAANAVIVGLGNAWQCGEGGVDNSSTGTPFVVAITNVP